MPQDSNKDILSKANSPDTLRAQRYSCYKYTLEIIEIIYLFAFILVFLGLGMSKIIVNVIFGFVPQGYLLFPAYLAAILILYYVLMFPFNIYGSFILEHKFGLTKQKIGDWLKDQLKAGALSYIISVIIFGAFYYILRHNPHNWWLVISLFWIGFSLILAKLTPVFIIPLFFKYKPLSDSALRERIINLSNKMKVKILDVFEIDFSKKTLKANAAFVGWGSTKRILLADTLKDKYSHDEIEVILAHEFAHYQMKHLLKLIIMNALSTVAVFYLIFKTNSYVLNIFGLSSLQDLAAFPVVVMYLMVFGIITQPLGNYISRAFEKDADKAAIKITGFKEAFISMMNKLSDQNLSDRSPNPIIKFLFFDHPPTDERVKMAESL